MLACVDVDYRPDGHAVAAALLFNDWTDAQEAQTSVVTIAQVAPYEPGAFYKRELPCLLEVLRPWLPGLTGVVIDGYVTLDAAGTPGLGAYLHAAVGGQIPVIGVAKTAYRGSAHAQAVRRGSGQQPLYVTTIGIELAEAARQVANMHGPHRLPTLLKRVDQLCRQGATGEDSRRPESRS